MNKKAIVDILLGDPAGAAVKLGWKPTITYEQLVSEWLNQTMLMH